MADYAAKEMNLKSMITITEDFAFGYEQMGGFQQTFEDNGGRILKKLWPPLTTPDYTPYLAQISDCDGVCQGFAGGNPLKFMKQYASAGLKFPVVTGQTGGDDALLRSYGDEAIGLVSCCPYTLDAETEANKRFVAGMQKNFNLDPGFYAAGLYINCMVIDEALKKAGGKSEDKAEFMKVLRSVSLSDTPRGPVKFDHLGALVKPFQIHAGGYQGVYTEGKWKQLFSSRSKQKRFEMQDRRGRRHERRAASHLKKSARKHLPPAGK